MGTESSCGVTGVNTTVSSATITSRDSDTINGLIGGSTKEYGKTTK